MALANFTPLAVQGPRSINKTELPTKLISYSFKVRLLKSDAVIMNGRTFSILLMFSIFLPTMIEENSTYRGLASAWNVIPSQSLSGLHYIFKGFTVNEDQGVVKVSGPVIEITDGQKLGARFDHDGFMSEIDSEDFEKEQELGQSIFEATTGNGLNVGTAFLVGNDLVLTNRHVMSVSVGMKKWECGKFTIKLNHKEEKVECAKIRFCSSRFDYCVVEMKKMANTFSIGSEVKPLRLTQRVKSHQDVPLLHIGNAGGLGIQASRGRGIKINGGEFYHFAPTLGGSSGAPIFDEKFAVLGLNWGQTGNDSLESTFNRGVLIKTIFEELSITHTRTLKEIKSFRSWYSRNQNHRKVFVRTKK